MFGVRIVMFAFALLGLAAAVPFDVAEAKPSKASYAKHHWRKPFAHPHTRKSSAKHHRRKYVAADRARRPIQSRASRRSSRIHVKGSAQARVGLGLRPARWCGWWMRSQLGGGPELNLARNWKGWGRPSGPRVGAVVVWSHHVGIITGRAGNGQWIVKSGNDGGRVRERPRSVAGAVFRVAG